MNGWTCGTCGGRYVIGYNGCGGEGRPEPPLPVLLVLLPPLLELLIDPATVAAEVFDTTGTVNCFGRRTCLTICFGGGSGAGGWNGVAGRGRNGDTEDL